MADDPANALPPEFVPHTNPFRRLGQHPIGFWFVFGGELAERASYYGMRTILALYLTSDAMKFSQAGGATIMKGFMAACYLTPFFGGWVAEKYLGRYKTILYYSIPYIIGHLILGGIQNKYGLFTALALLAFGSGAIKPNTSVLMGQIYEANGKKSMLTEAFSLFYAAVNIGAAVTSLGLPPIRDHYGYGVALAVPAVLMAVAFIAFAAGRRFYPDENVRAERPPKTEEQRALEKRTLLRIAGVFAVISIFWLIYDQNADTWIYFGNQHCIGTFDPVNKVTHLKALPPFSIGSWHFDGTITADQVQGLNPVFIIFLTPIFNWIWGRWRKARGGVEIPDTRKMMVGFGIVLATTALMATAAFLARGDAKVSVWWVIVATFIVTLAELCISVVGLEFAYKVASEGTKSIVTAAFHMTVFAGDTIGLGLAPFYEKQLKAPAYFAVQAVIMTIASGVFIPISRRFERGEKKTA